MIKKLRYLGLKYYSRFLTPSLYQSILKEITNQVLLPYNIIDRNYHRPAINNIMKNYSLFKGKSLKGAEIGVFYGLNASNILNTLNIDKLYLVDIWNDINNDANYHGIKPYYSVVNLFKGNNKIEIIRDYSNKAVKRFKDDSLDFVYIDGNHTYDFVLQDISLWANKVKENGIIAGHDIHRSSIYNAVKDFTKKNEIHFSILAPDWYFYKYNN